MNALSESEVLIVEVKTDTMVTGHNRSLHASTNTAIVRGVIDGQNY
jgi:hypothetical protein